MSRALALLALITLGACSAGDGSGSSESPAGESGASNTVTIEGIAYDPPSLEVEGGDLVTWTNRDSVQHTVTSGRQAEQGVPGVSKGKDATPDGAFDGSLDDEGATFTFTFDRPGTYAYYCEIHVGMVGEIVVR